MMVDAAPLFLSLLTDHSMPIEIACPSCQKRMRAPDAAAGKHVKCPACQAPIVVPSPRPAAPIERWTLLTEDDQQFGPVSRTELDRWLAEGRINTQCQLLREGAPAWQWAPDVYPSLKQQPALAPIDPLGIGTKPVVTSQPTYVAPQPTYYSPSPTYRTSRSSGGGSVGTATALAYVGGGTIAVRALLWIIFRALAISSIPRFNSQYAAAAAVETVIQVVIVLILASVAAIPYFVAAIGLGRRRLWGKILGFVSSGISCIIALLILVLLLRQVVNYFRMTTMGFPLPAEFHLRIAGGMLLDLIFLAIMIGHAIITIMVLVNSKNSQEFRA